MNIYTTDSEAVKNESPVMPYWIVVGPDDFSGTHASMSWANLKLPGRIVEMADTVLLIKDDDSVHVLKSKRGETGRLQMPYWPEQSDEEPYGPLDREGNPITGTGRMIKALWTYLPMHLQEICMILRTSTVPVQLDRVVHMLGRIANSMEPPSDLHEGRSSARAVPVWRGLYCRERAEETGTRPWRMRVDDERGDPKWGYVRHLEGMLDDVSDAVMQPGLPAAHVVSAVRTVLGWKPGPEGGGP